MPLQYLERIDHCLLVVCILVFPSLVSIPSSSSSSRCSWRELWQKMWASCGAEAQNPIHDRDRDCALCPTYCPQAPGAEESDPAAARLRGEASEHGNPQRVAALSKCSSTYTPSGSRASPVPRVRSLTPAALPSVHAAVPPAYVTQAVPAWCELYWSNSAMSFSVTADSSLGSTNREISAPRGMGRGWCGFSGDWLASCGTTSTLCT